MRTYTHELKAQVIAEWLQGGSYSGLALRYNVPRSTVQRWTQVYERTLPVPKKADREELGALIYEFLILGFKALIAHARAAASPEFAGKADEAWHQRFGTFADKLLIVAGAVQRGQGPIELNPGSESGTDSPGSPLPP